MRIGREEKEGEKAGAFLHFIEFSPLIIEGCLSLYTMWFASVIDGRREGGTGGKEIRQGREGTREGNGGKGGGGGAGGGGAGARKDE